MKPWQPNHCCGNGNNNNSNNNFTQNSMDIYTHCYMNISSYSKLIQLGNTEKRTMEELDIIRVMEKEMKILLEE
ncbi:unnamed protein product [Schistosoma mattheei]|uniref:Uncharacterized protein n=1 Tax=Schistosoma mattheei TaxID=31246 RepID=A0AA85AW89_9TREM|nr:unnamed protein product [Schistosoma mattheei]